MRKKPQILRYQDSQPYLAVSQTPEAPIPPAGLPQGVWRYVAYACSLMPAAGAVLGLLFVSSPQPEARRFGRVCLVLAVIGLMLGCLVPSLNLPTPDSGEKWIESFY